MDEKTLAILAMAFQNTLGNDSLTELLRQLRMAAEQLESNAERNAAWAFAACLSNRMQAAEEAAENGTEARRARR